MKETPAVTAGRNSERNFYTGMSIAFAIVVVAGFTRSFFLRPLFPEVHEFIPPEAIFTLHGIIFSLWIVLIVCQALLIRSRRVDLHRATGWFGVALAVIVVWIGSYGALLAANRPGGFLGIPLPPEQFLIFPVGDITLFAVFVALAVVWRTSAQTHKRLMLLATVNLMEAAIVRMPIPFMLEGAPFTSRGLSFLFIVALALWDRRSLGSLHRVTLWGGLLIVLSFPARLLLMETGAWTAAAEALMAIVD